MPLARGSSALPSVLFVLVLVNPNTVLLLFVIELLLLVIVVLQGYSDFSFFIKDILKFQSVLVFETSKLDVKY